MWPGAISEAEYKKRAELWHSLHRLEVLLSEVNGRPKCVQVADVTVAYDWGAPDQSDAAVNPARIKSRIDSHGLWLAFLGHFREVAVSFTGGEVSWRNFGNIGSGIPEKHFSADVQLSHISAEIGTKLYSASMDITWLDVQRTIQLLEIKLQRWSDALPAELKLKQSGQTKLDPRSSLELAMYSSSIRMMLYRPCLCEISVVGESRDRDEFNRASARACVKAALQTLDVIPNNPIVSEILQILPWWSLLHYVCQAATVLILELCLSMRHMQSEENPVIFSALKKAMNFLWYFSAGSKSAHKAWTILRLLIKKCMHLFPHYVLLDIPTEAPQPADWNENDKITMAAVIVALQ